MGVLLSRGQALVSQELLDNSEVSSSTEEMGGKRMAERMGADLSPHCRKMDILVYDSFHGTRGESCSTVVQKERVVVDLSLVDKVSCPHIER